MYKKGTRKGTVKFTIKPATAARKVLVAGDFSSWKPVEMKKQDDGQYAAQITADPGTHEYKFVVDGQWLVDPENMVRRLNRFGTENSVATIA